ncbi:GLIPR1-like protein 1, partial [Trichomycterus rosablanca]|uniref:GLIPR1-like protein 1 n=1 Tax=Trichomycterus rosablanca TaxID=2290929 RepID=UPI002F35B4D2
TLKCTDVCGHYTQVVWAESYKVGCAVVDCPGGVRNTDFSHRPGAIFICNYATAGNYQGVPPYKRGPACSQCGGERCEENLCRNSTRDSETGNSTPDSETGDKWTAGGVR